MQVILIKNFLLQVNGTGRIIPSDVVSGKRTSQEVNNHLQKVQESEEFESFARNRTGQDSSTPNREDKREPRDPETQIKDTPRERSTGNTRPKNYSTVSLPNYDELDVTRHREKGTKDQKDGGSKAKPRRPVRSSTGSLPAASFLSPFSEVCDLLRLFLAAWKHGPNKLKLETDVVRLC